MERIRAFCKPGVTGSIPVTYTNFIFNPKVLTEFNLYGSFARNQQDTASDVDVLVIGKPQSGTLAETVQKLERQLGREINYTVLTRKELESRRGRKDAFLENVWHTKRVLLVGAA